MVVLLLGCAGLMLNAPNLLVHMQIIIGLVISAIAMTFVGTKPKEN